VEAAKNGDTKAQDKLGDMYRVGRIVTKDLQTAFNYYQKASQLPTVLCKIGICYADGIGVKKDSKMAFLFFFEGR